MEPLDAFALASSTFVGVLDQVRPDQLTSPTPCDDWDVKELLGHLIVGCQMTVALLDGASQDEAKSYWGQVFGDDVADVCREAIAAEQLRYRTVTDWDRPVHHVVGDIPSGQLLGFRIGDLTLHAWDLATAIGVDDGIPDELAAVIYENMKPMEAFIGEIGMFGSGPSGTVAADAPVKVRLLDLTGRRS